MTRLLLTIAAILLSCGAGQAQSRSNSAISTSPALGATSPLGTLGSSASGSPTGIPLGATQLNPGGLSPMPCTPTSASLAVASSSMAQSMSSPGFTFDGGGMDSSGCATGSTTPLSSTGNASPFYTSGATLGSPLSGGTIPLGATEVDSGGVSPMITVLQPSLPPPMSIQMPGLTSSPTFVSGLGITSSCTGGGRTESTSTTTSSLVGTSTSLTSSTSSGPTTGTTGTLGVTSPGC